MQDTGQASAERFAFGSNWRKFLRAVDEGRIRDAQVSLTTTLGVEDLRGRSVLDVGCGSGLFSLAAVRLGAREVRSFDFDPDSVETTRILKQRYAPDAPWTVEWGDATDERLMASLGMFDLVYSWGVLHHTGQMWRALENTAARVAAGGHLFISIYNDQGPKSRRWRPIKELYNRLPRLVRAPYAVAVMLPSEAHQLFSAAIRGRAGSYIRTWTSSRERGMSRWHDLLDWVGGYPFEVAKPEEVFRFCRERGLELVELKTCGGGLGCNEFVFRRNAD